MKNLEEIDCNESIWNSAVAESNNGWGQLESQLSFVYQTTDKKISTDDIEYALCEKFDTLDNISVEKVKVDDGEKGMRYFCATVTVYNSGI